MAFLFHMPRKTLGMHHKMSLISHPVSKFSLNQEGTIPDSMDQSSAEATIFYGDAI